MRHLEGRDAVREQTNLVVSTASLQLETGMPFFWVRRRLGLALYTTYIVCTCCRVGPGPRAEERRREKLGQRNESGLAGSWYLDTRSF